VIRIAVGWQAGKRALEREFGSPTGVNSAGEAAKPARSSCGRSRLRAPVEGAPMNGCIAARGRFGTASCQAVPPSIHWAARLTREGDGEGAFERQQRRRGR
jgi:hypothetical protein